MIVLRMSGSFQIPAVAVTPAHKKAALAPPLIDIQLKLHLPLSCDERSKIAIVLPIG